MNFGPYRFAPPWWGILAFLVAAAILCALGVWQIDRGQAKERLIAAQKAARKGGTVPMRIAHAPSSGDGRNATLVYGRRYIVEGVAESDHQILLNDQVEGTRNGYRVWLPVRLDSGVRVLVDRGWIPADPTEPGGQAPTPNPAAPSGRVRMVGLWRRFPQPGIRLGNNKTCNLSGWPRRLNFPGAAEVRCQYRAPVANGLLLLDPKAPHGFVRHWDESPGGISPFRHFAYAVQWFLMALTAAIIFIVVNSKRRV